MKGYFYVFCTILFTIYGQIILKWRLNQLKGLSETFQDKMIYVFRAFTDFYVLSGFLSAFIASLFWMLAMTKLELTKAYPFMSLSPPLVFLFGVLFLGESFTWGKVMGLVLIVAGTLITVRF